ncbi:hypothetical protein [Methylobacterium sp. J-067]|jgi:hypothetical protein|uniref:hypothetical protein n=1 Tax=Methylobacterium sp. J-067 TaxID=2836648 RepID=UPI001FBACEE2|nr:hypothetical protein [Methylobacterium sp. J-067]MCJ2024768.1 hypothetical protein [Methylobacterium sp. J-067]
MLYDHLAPKKPHRRPRTTERVSKPSRPLTRREREDIADAHALRIVGGRTLVFHMSVVDPSDLDTDLEGTGLDLVVATTTPSAAYSAWERHAEAVGAVGAHCVKMTYTPVAPAGKPAGKRAAKRPEEVVVCRMVDLDWLQLCDDLAVLDDEDRALGFPVYRREGP